MNVPVVLFQSIHFLNRVHYCMMVIVLFVREMFYTISTDSCHALDLDINKIYSNVILCVISGMGILILCLQEGPEHSAE